MMVALPIFIVLMAVLIGVSMNTRVKWDYEPTGQHLQTLASSTAISFANANGEGAANLPARDTYEVQQHYETLDVREPSTGDVQHIKILVHEPKAPHASNLPGVVFMHGAGYGTCDNSFGDVATALSSAGIVTAVLDKPVWNTNDATRDYPGSAYAYDQVINLVRGMSNVDAKKVGIYATSESTWISSYLLEQDHNIAFQVLLSPMVFSPRVALGFLAAQDFALAGAHDGYQSIVRRVFSFDTAMFGLTNIDLNTLNPQAYSIPTLVAYGSKDVMTAQVEGVKEILKNAHEAGNRNVTIRSYPVANHVLRLGNEANAGTPLADNYVNDVIAWTNGTVDGLKETTPAIAGSELYQSIAVPTDLHAQRSMTIYAVVIHLLMALMLVVTLIIWLVAVIRWIVDRVRKRPRHSTLGFQNGFGKAMLTLSVVTMATLVLFFAGFGEVVMGVVQLAWGSAPTDDPGVMYWSWPVIQIVCVVVVWAWSLVFRRMIEVASLRGIAQWPMRKGAVREIVRGERPVLATTRLGRVLFWVSAATMFTILLVFAFWGVFVY